MRKAALLLTTLTLFYGFGLKAQVGINTTNPKGTLHIIPTSIDGSTAEGIIAPNLKRSEVVSKDLQYTADQRGAIVYVSEIDGTTTTKTAKILALGYYYFDGSLWQPFSAPVATVTTANNGLAMSGTTVQLGGALIKATDITGTSRLTLATPTTVSGALQISSGTPGAGKFLTSDATGNATWGTLPAAPTISVTTANNGLAMSGTTVQLGGALTKATSITGTAANTLTIGAPAIVSGALRISSGTPGAGKYLTSDATGNATWGTLPAAPTIPVTTANNGLAMSGTTVQLGGALTKATSITGTATNTLTISAPAIVSGALRISSGTPGAGKFLTSDATGNATWGTLPAATVTTANNGLAMSGTTVQLGGALTKATSITGTATNTLTIGAPAIVSGALRISSGTPGAGKFLTSDATGNATWGTLPAAPTIPTEPWQVQGGTTAATSNAQNIYQTGSVAVGTNTANGYKFQVTGTSNVTGNSRVASSTVVGAQTVGTTLAVTGTSALTGNVGIGGAANATYTLRVAGTSYVTGNSFVAGNLGLGTTAVNQRLNVSGNSWVSGLSRLGGSNTTAYNASAQLELADNNKGFLPNRVALTDLKVKAPVANAVNGMIVYNTATVVAKQISPGLYYWLTDSWRRLVDRTESVDANMLILRTDVVSKYGDANSTGSGNLMSFTDKNYITIPDDGAYVFTFRLYGALKNGRPADKTQMVPYYIAMTLSGSTVPLDLAEMDIVPANRAGSDEAKLTYSVTLSANLKSQDKVQFKISHYGGAGNNYPWTLVTGAQSSANRTSMVWWKL